MIFKTLVNTFVNANLLAVNGLVRLVAAVFRAGRAGPDFGRVGALLRADLVGFIDWLVFWAGWFALITVAIFKSSSASGDADFLGTDGLV